jgi:hypothetical protein
MTVDDFIQKSKTKKKSVFYKYLEDIKKLIENDISQRDIIDYLKSKTKNHNGLTQANLSQFLKRNKVEKKDILQIPVKSDSENLIAVFEKEDVDQDESAKKNQTKNETERILQIMRASHPGFSKKFD